MTLTQCQLEQVRATRLKVNSKSNSNASRLQTSRRPYVHDFWDDGVSGGIASHSDQAAGRKRCVGVTAVQRRELTDDGVQ